jgi:fluoroacetyl-CoA thioesterase
LIEHAAAGCVAPTLEPGQGTVGTAIAVRHLAATPVGMTVTARAELTEIDGRRLVFKVEARDAVELVAEGTHERFVINSIERFVARAEAKRTEGNPVA